MTYSVPFLYIERSGVSGYYKPVLVGHCTYIREVYALLFKEYHGTSWGQGDINNSSCFRSNVVYFLLRSMIPVQTVFASAHHLTIQGEHLNPSFQHTSGSSLSYTSSIYLRILCQETLHFVLLVIFSCPQVQVHYDVLPPLTQTSAPFASFTPSLVSAYCMVE